MYVYVCTHVHTYVFIIYTSYVHIRIYVVHFSTYVCTYIVFHTHIATFNFCDLMHKLGNFEFQYYVQVYIPCMDVCIPFIVFIQ